MNFITSQAIIPGQLTMFRDVLYRAENKAPHLPCVAQCDCHMPEWADSSYGCSGFCYRWANGDDIVFKRVNAFVSHDLTIIETPFAAACRESEVQLQGGEAQAMEVLVLQRKLNNAKKELRDRDIEDFFNRKKTTNP